MYCKFTVCVWNLCCQCFYRFFFTVCGLSTSAVNCCGCFISLWLPVFSCCVLGGSISKKGTSRLDKLIRRVGSVIGMKLDPLVTVDKTLKKLLDIMDNASHPLHTVISNQRSLFSERLLLPKCRTNRLQNSFVPKATLKNNFFWPCNYYFNYLYKFYKKILYKVCKIRKKRIAKYKL